MWQLPIDRNVSSSDLNYSVVFDPTAEGAIQTAKCPYPAFSGSLTRVCVANSTNWAAVVQGQCTRHICPTGLYKNTINEYPWPGSHPVKVTRTVQIPAGEYGSCIQVPYCSKFSPTGSCVDADGDSGYVTMTCQLDASWELTGGTFIPAVEYEGARMTQSALSAVSFYSEFARVVSGAMHQGGMAGSWALLPTTGVFTAVTIGLNTERRQVFSTAAGPMDRSVVEATRTIGMSSAAGNVTSLSPQHIAAGRAAAAFARVACREMGYSAAPVATNCRGLAQLLDALPHQATSNATKQLLAALCPELAHASSTSNETNCPNWFEVRDPPIGNPANTQLQWARAYASNPEQKGTMFRAIHDSDLPSWQHLQSFSQVGPVPESPSCDGTEANVTRCFQHQMMIPLKMRQSWTRNCHQRMLVACSDPTATMAVGEQKELQTWVIGDGDGDGARALKGPTVFEKTHGPVNCSTGILATREEIQRGVERLCWGTLLDVEHT